MASSQLVETFAPLLRRIVKARLCQRKVGGLIDPLDITQIVFGSFFSRISSDWPRVESMDQLTALLIAMARNRLRDELRRHTAIRRDHRRLGPDRTVAVLHQIETKEPSPGQVVEYLELRGWVVSALTGDEWSLLEERLSGKSWAAIADERGNPAALLRKKLNRAVMRVRQQLAR